MYFHPETGRYAPIAFVWLIGILGAASLVYDAVLSVRAVGLEFSGSSAADKVIRNECSSACYPVVAFQTSDGKQIEFKASVGSEPADYAEGDGVTVVYQPEHPERAMLRSFTHERLSPVFFDFIGLLFTAVFLVRNRILNQENVRAAAASAGSSA
jgi:hypothetical protein